MESHRTIAILIAHRSFGSCAKSKLFPYNKKKKKKIFDKILKTAFNAIPCSDRHLYCIKRNRCQYTYILKSHNSDSHSSPLLLLAQSKLFPYTKKKNQKKIAFNVIPCSDRHLYCVKSNKRRY